jgi:hypothetical protein
LLARAQRNRFKAASVDADGPQEMSDTLGSERRKLRRIVKRIPAAFEAGRIRSRGHIKNVTKVGLFVRCEELPTTGEKVRVVFHDRNGCKVEVRGEVRWTTEQLRERTPKPGFGVHIDTPSPEFLDFYEQILLG